MASFIQADTVPTYTHWDGDRGGQKGMSRVPQDNYTVEPKIINNKVVPITHRQCCLCAYHNGIAEVSEQGGGLKYLRATVTKRNSANRKTDAILATAAASNSQRAGRREAAACPALPSAQIFWAALPSVATQRLALVWPFLGPLPPERTVKKFQERHRLNAGGQPSFIPTKVENRPLLPPPSLGRQ